MEPPGMARTKDGGEDAPAPEYLSPKRVLARAFEKSRDRWKAKYKVLQKQLKARLTEVRDLNRSRARWRAKAEAWEREARTLRAELQPRAESSPPALSGPSPP
jgi:hypothetical protein